MAYRERKSLNIVLLIVVAVMVVIITLSIIILNVITSDWGFYEIFTTIGGAFMIVGGIGIYGSFAGGNIASSATRNTAAIEIARAEIDYARKSRKAFPIVSFILFGIGIIFLAIGMSGLWT